MSTTKKFTPGSYFVGAQNDALFIVAGRAPAQNNDHPWHDAPRVAIAKMLGPVEGDCLPVDAAANGALFAAAPDLYEALQNAIEALAMCAPSTQHGAACHSAAMFGGRAALAKSGAVA